MQRFYWLVEGVLAGCSRPGKPESEHGPERPDIVPAMTPEMAEALDRDLALLRSKGIGAILSLTESPVDDAALIRQEFITLHLPVADLTAPSPAQLHEALRFIDRQQMEGVPVAVHCLMGQGRTGTVLAAYLIRGGMTASEAIARLRFLAPGAISTPTQERALEDFAKRREWIV